MTATTTSKACPPYESTTGQALYDLSRGRDDEQNLNLLDQQQNLLDRGLKHAAMTIFHFSLLTSTNVLEYSFTDIIPQY